MASIAFIAMCYTACGDSFHTDSCDEVYYPNYKLADCQKEVGNFQKGKTTHYIHSNGFEFDLTVIKDSTFTDKWSDFCTEAKEEDRIVQLASTYPIITVKVNFYGKTEKKSKKTASDSSKPMTVSHGGTSYQMELDSAGNPQETGIKGDVSLLDTITFNGVTYDSVFVIMDSGHYDALNYNDKTFANGKLSHLYFSKTKGILKFETTNGESFTIKEGDNE